MLQLCFPAHEPVFFYYYYATRELHRPQAQSTPCSAIGAQNRTTQQPPFMFGFLVHRTLRKCGLVHNTLHSSNLFDRHYDFVILSTRHYPNKIIIWKIDDELKDFVAHGFLLPLKLEDINTAQRFGRLASLYVAGYCSAWIWSTVSWSPPLALSKPISSI